MSDSAAPSAKFTEEYAVAVETAELIAVRLIKSEFAAEPEAFARDQSNWKRGYGCESQSSAFNPARTILSGAVLAEVACRIGRKRVVHLKCRYLIDYAIAGSPTDRAAHAFFDRIAPFTAYPYFRAHFAEVTDQAGLEIGPLPVMKDQTRIIEKVKTDL